MSEIIGFIGFGLIGGSIAKGLKKVHPDWKMLACSRTAGKLEAARADGVLDEIVTSPKELAGCDFIFLCTPVSCIPGYLAKLKDVVKPGCILTDVGSTKSNVHHAVLAQGLSHCFIGGHPMAGSEQTGYENATDHLVENAYYVLTPTPQSSPADLKKLTALVLDLHGIPLVLDPEEHDSVVAAVSHLPHLIAAGLVNLVARSDSSRQTMKTVAAGGFKDITRIASSSPEMWQQICMENRENIMKILRDYIADMEGIYHELENSDAAGLFRLFEESGEYRSSISDRSAGPLKKEYAVYCDIVDEAGAIATIATILSVHQISIKNIGIVHNREFEQGALKIVFYDEDSASRAAETLNSCHYHITVR